LYDTIVGDDRMVQIGGPALGEDFHDRERELLELKRKVLKNNILITAPRRFGKTSLLRKFEGDMKKNGYTVIYLDVMDVSSPERFVHELTLAAFDEADLREDFFDKLKKIFKGLTIDAKTPVASLKLELSKVTEDNVNEKTWHDTGREIVKAIVSSSEKKPVIVILDELPEAVSNMKKKGSDAVEFLQWFRKVRQKVPEIKFIVAGSTSFEKVVESISGRNAYINDMYTISLSGFSKEDALKFLETAFEEDGLPFTEGIGNKILELVGEPYVPYFLAVFVDILYEATEEGMSPDEIFNLLEEVYWSKLLGSEGTRYFRDYGDRLKIYYSEYIEPVKEILKEAAGSEEGINVDLAKEIFLERTGCSEDEFNLLLRDLENDFYISVRGDRIIFQSKLMRDWWGLNYG